MKNTLFLSLIFSIFPGVTTHTHSLVFVHLGTSPIPDYTLIALKQARLFNPDCPFYFIANKNNLYEFPKITKKYNVICVAAESLAPTEHHIHFLKTSRLDRNWHHGFWQFTTERFFYIEELMRAYNLRDVFHLENDIMLYVDLGTLLPVFQQNYPGIGITFGSDNMCVPGFIYIPSAEAFAPITRFLAQHAHQGQDDGLTLAKCKNELGSHHINAVPTIFAEYSQHHVMKNLQNEVARDPQYFSQFEKQFKSLFDAAALGQLMGGWSPLSRPYWGENGPFINHWTLFNPQHVPVVWERDERGRNIPYATFEHNGEILKLRINNLHIHSKELERFCS